VELMREARETPGIRKVLVASGILLVLIVAFVVFGVLVLATFWPDVQATFEAGEQLGETPGGALFSGAQYVSYNLVVLPAAFFALYRQTRRSETFTSGLAAGLLGSIPFVITFLCLMAFYPDEAVIGAEVPWLAMLNEVGGTLLVGAYAIVVLWTLVETATGLIHAIMNRINIALEAVDRTPLRGPTSAIITIVVLAAAVALAQFGIIALVAQGYGAMAYGFFILFALPLLTVGVYKIWKTPAVTPAGGDRRDQSLAG
jgi:uncharacterized membrane protein YkvI